MATESRPHPAVDYAAFFDLTTDAIAVVRRDGVMVAANEALAQLHATTRDALVGRSALELIDPEDHRQALALLTETAEGTPVTNVLLRAITADGSRRLFSWSGTIRGDLAYCVGRDVSAEHALTDRLLSFERAFLSWFETHPLPMYVVELDDFRLLAVNDATVSQYGWSRDELLTLTLADLRSPDEWHRHHELFGQIHRGDVHAGIALPGFVHRRKDGTDFEVEITWNTIAYEGRRAALVLAVDISERRRAEERLEEQAALLDRASDAIFVFRPSGEITFWNAAAERIFGIPAEAARGRNVTALLVPAEATWESARTLLSSQGEWHGTLELRPHEAEALDLELSLTLVRDRAGEPTQVLAIAADVGERKRLEAQFLRAQRLESLGTLAGGIAHDLNNVLAPILMSVTVLRERTTDPRSVRLLDSLQETAERGAAIVRQVLGFARGMEGSPILLQPRRVMEDVANFARETFPRNIRITTAVPHDLWSIYADATQIHQVLINLCVNARDAMPNGGELMLEAENVELDGDVPRPPDIEAGPFLVLKVIDTGAGIPPEISDRIFDPFFTSKPLGQGTGLGLSTALAIVRGHGGFIDVYSEPGRGSAFKIYLPASPPETTHDSDPGSDEVLRGDGELVLLVDDEVAVLNVTAQTLEAFGYRVVTAGNGALAVARFAERPKEFAVVITDLMMPVMDGPATVAALRTLEPGCRIIAASGLTGGSTPSRGFDLEVDAVIAKPFSATVLLRTLREVLNAPRRES